MANGQSSEYKYVSRIDYLGNMVGGDRARDLIKTEVVSAQSPLRTTQTNYTPHADFAVTNGGTLQANGTLADSLRALGASELHITAAAGKAFDVRVVWQDSGGNQIFQETLVSGQSANSRFETTVSDPPTPYPKVTIANTTGDETTATLTAYMV